MNFLKIGYVRSSHGIKGALKARFSKKHIPSEGDDLYFEKTSDFIGPFNLISLYKYGQSDWIIRITDCNDKNQANKLSGYSVGIEKPNLEENTHWVDDIKGCSVYTTEGTLVGDIRDVLSTGANDVYVVYSKQGKEILIPASKSVITSIDTENKKIIIKALPGLLE